MLVGQLNDDVKHIFLSIAENSDFEIEVMETDADQTKYIFSLLLQFFYFITNQYILPSSTSLRKK